MKAEADMVGFRIDLQRVIFATPLPTPPGTTPLVTFTPVGVGRFRIRNIIGVPANADPQLLQAA